MTRPIGLAIAGVLFALLATANAAGYRYGGSDQAFYIPAVTRALEPGAFPRDGALIDAQARLIVVDDALALAARTTGLSIESLFLLGYLCALALTWWGLVLIGERLYGSPWLIAALGAVITLRHRIPQTSANSFEPYFHPRMLAFALGLLAVGALLRGRHWITVGLVATAAIVHTTTALWFAVLLGVALAVLVPLFRTLALVGAVAAAGALAWAVASGPLQHAWVTMDATWLQAVASKDSLFADEWPAWVWAANVGMLAALWAAVLRRRRRGAGAAVDMALVWGATALAAVFVATLPFVAARLSLAVEFQISRIFWLIDILATVYLVGELESLVAWRPHAVRYVVAVLVALSVGRGVYVMTVEHPERALFAIHVPPSAWEDAMAWVRQQPLTTHVLADPGHGWKYGTSVRVSGERDVFLEEVKDSAIAIYSHDVAARFVERTTALGDFAQLTAERARNLARRYDLDVLVTTADLPLPIAYQNPQFRIYTLRDRSPQ